MPEAKENVLEQTDEEVVEKALGTEQETPEEPSPSKETKESETETPKTDEDTTSQKS